MKVLLVNGSPHPHGCTDAALRTVAGALEARGAETELLHLGAGSGDGAPPPGRGAGAGLRRLRRL